MPPSALRPARSPRGFSLIELLVAMAIVAVLIGLLFPTIGALRQRGRVVHDLNNMRQLAIAHVAYMSDHDTSLIDAGLPHGAPQDESVAWINTLSPYLDGSTDVIQSPLDQSPHWPGTDGGRGVPLPGTDDRFRRTSYGINNYLTQFAPDDPFRRLDSVRAPARTVHFLPMAWTGEFAGADHVHVENWWIGEQFPDAPPTLADDMVAINAVAGNAIETPDQASEGWLSRATYTFLDGHVETVPFVEMFRTPDINRFDPSVAWRVDRTGRQGD